MKKKEVKKPVAESSKSVSELSQLVADYRLCAQAEDRSDSYINLVRTVVTLFMDFLISNGFVTDVVLIGANEIRGFFRHLQSVNKFSKHPYAHQQDKKLSGHTLNTYARTLRAFFGWLEFEQIVGTNPFQTVKVPKAPKKVVPIFREDQIKAMLAQIDITTGAGFRNYTVIIVLLDTLMRISELTGCDLEDLRLESREIKVVGKGNKERLLPFGKAVQKALWRYIRFYRAEPVIPNKPRLFLTAEGRPLTKNRVEQMFKHYGQKAGIEGVRVSPHTLRHTGAVLFLRNGGDVFTLQRMLGHSSLETVKLYVNLSQDDISRVHRRASPIDNLDLKSKPNRKL